MHFTLKKIEENPKIGLLTFDHQGEEMNIFGEEALTELDAKIDEIAASDLDALIIISGKKNSFVAGADIKKIESFGNATEAEEGAATMQAIFQKIADLPQTTVAAVHGVCLGGGTEMILACDWRIATDDKKTKIGLPEIQLGLLPGAGGTQRLPRLIGIQAALDMILTGKRLDSKRALRKKLVDGMVHPNQLLQEAIKLTVRTRKEDKADIQRWALEGNVVGRSIMQKKAREMVDKTTKGKYPAPYLALKSVFEGYDKSLKQGLEIEAKYFGELFATRESKSLIHLFHATTALKKHPYKGAAEKKFGTDEATSLIGVIGAGFMGAGIATVCADKGVRVRVSDPSEQSVGSCLKHVRAHFNKQADRKRIKRFEVDQKFSLVSPGMSTEGLESTQICIEAAPEVVDLKRKILKGFEGKVNDQWIFATNTSALPIKDIAKGSKLADRVLGMHFFSPVEKMPLLEIVKTDKTADWAIDRAVELGFKMGKQVIVVDDGPGFYTTRALAFYLAEAAIMVAEGVKIETIDQALTKFGYPVGPIALIDEVGIDVSEHVLDTVVEAYPDRIAKPEGITAIIADNRLGRKNKRGFYTYTDDKKDKPDPSVYPLISKASAEEAPNLTEEEIVDRCNLVFINESMRCLEDGVLNTASDGDVGAVFGLGFPPFLGGPFHYARAEGADKITARLSELAKKYGKRFEPANILKDNKF